MWEREYFVNAWVEDVLFARLQVWGIDMGKKKKKKAGIFNILIKKNIS